MAIPVPDVANQTSAINTVQPLDIAVPSGVSVGDFLLLLLGNDATADLVQWDAGTWFPTGWTFLVEGGGSTGQAHLGVFYRTADAGLISAGSVSVPARSSNDYFGFMVKVAGVDTGDPINVVGTPTQAAAQTSHNVPAVTTDAADCLALYLLSFNGGDGFPYSVSGTGWSEGGEVQTGTGGAVASGTWGHKDVASAGSTGNATVTSAVSDASVVVQFALNGVSGTPHTATVADDVGLLDETSEAIGRFINVTRSVEAVAG